MTTAYATARRRRPPSGVRSTLPWLFAVLTVATQISYPLLDGEPLRWVTLATVACFFLASTTHAAAHRGAGWAAWFVLVTVGGGLLAEAIGVATGYPFGHYTYDGSLGPQVFDVPLIVPLAWGTVSYPAFLAGQRVGGWFAPLVAGLGLASWDVFLDPQMVDAGRWRWHDGHPAIPGIPHIPWTNFAGWLAVAVVMMAVLQALLPAQAGISEAQPATLFLWTWIGNVLGSAVFFDRPAVAVFGGVAMGVVALPYVRSVWHDRP